LDCTSYALSWLIIILYTIHGGFILSKPNSMFLLFTEMFSPWLSSSHARVGILDEFNPQILNSVLPDAQINLAVIYYFSSFHSFKKRVNASVGLTCKRPRPRFSSRAFIIFLVSYAYSQGCIYVFIYYTFSKIRL